MRDPLPIGSIVKPYGKVVSIGLTGGERYYWLINKAGTVAMMPADHIEGLADRASPRKGAA